MLRRTTPMRLFWAKDYSDYHPEAPGGSAAGRTCECRPLDTSILGAYRSRLRPGVMKVSIPMPTTGADYRWLNLMARVPSKGLPLVAKRLAQGLGGLLLGRHYVAGGQALAAALFCGVLRAGIPIWTDTTLTRLTTGGGRITGAVVEQNGEDYTITAQRGVVLAAGGFDHSMDMRWKFQSEALQPHASLGAETNTGDAIRIGQEVGAAIDLMEQSWWFPAVAPLPGGSPAVMLAERSLPGSLIVDQEGERFTNESADYMSFGQCVLAREHAGRPVETMWIVFDQQYRNSYVFAAELFPRMPIPQAWYEAGIAHKSDDLGALATLIGIPRERFLDTITRFNEGAYAGEDPDFHRGQSAYDRYYGDPTVTPNPNLRPLTRGPFYAVKMVLSDLGTCGGLRADDRARVLREDGTASTVSTPWAIPRQTRSEPPTPAPGRPSRRAWSSATSLPRPRRETAKLARLPRTPPAVRLRASNADWDVAHRPRHQNGHTPVQPRRDPRSSVGRVRARWRSTATPIAAPTVGRPTRPMLRRRARRARPVAACARRTRHALAAIP